MSRFKFGRNWLNFSQLITEENIRSATESLSEMLMVESLAGKTFLDIGCGSGLFSLAACRLGAARVVSFDYDPDSVACANALKDKYGKNYDWQIMSGDVLDKDWLSAMGTFDVVYSWGVLHHTGKMWEALENAASPVKNEGLLFVSIYNDQGFISKVWAAIKYIYNRSPSLIQWLLCVGWLIIVGLNRIFQGLMRGKPLSKWFVGSERGMNLWYDVVDWVGGYPFETASLVQLKDFYSARGFIGINDKAKFGSGCNELVLRRASKS